MKKAKTSKRILSVKIKRMIDTDPDTSHLGEYANRPANEFSIDRMHSEDCASLEHVHRDALSKLERVKEHINDLYNANLGTFNGALGDSPAHIEQESLDAAEQTILDAQDEVQACDCGGNLVSSRECRYFNPSFNYVTREGKPADGLTPEEVRTYTRQDYERMKALNNGSWCYLGIRAEAELGIGEEYPTRFNVTRQTITSGSIWGIESDSDNSFFKETAEEQLHELRTQLEVLGFSKRAISIAFKNVKEVSE